MKKQFILTNQVAKFVETLTEDSQNKYQVIVDRLEEDGYLVEPFGKKLKSEKNLFEIRIMTGENARIIYCYDDGDYIFGVHGFIKKDQKTPKKEIEKAKKAIRKILNSP